MFRVKKILFILSSILIAHQLNNIYIFKSHCFKSFHGKVVFNIVITDTYLLCGTRRLVSVDSI